MQVGYEGIVPLHRWLSKDEFVAQLSKRDIKVVSKKPCSDEWELFLEPELTLHKGSV